MTTRSTLIPPPVEPTQPPMTIMTMNNCRANSPKYSDAMSLVPNPVVVMIETT